MFMHFRNYSPTDVSLFEHYARPANNTTAEEAYVRTCSNQCEVNPFGVNLSNHRLDNAIESQVAEV